MYILERRSTRAIQEEPTKVRFGWVLYLRSLAATQLAAVANGDGPHARVACNMIDILYLFNTSLLLRIRCFSVYLLSASIRGVYVAYTILYRRHCEKGHTLTEIHRLHFVMCTTCIAYTITRRHG